MTTGTRSAVSMLTDFFASDAIEAAARRTGFVKRTSKLTGKLFLALVTFGAWSDATTTLAQLAAKVTQWDEQVEVSPEAIHQLSLSRLNAKCRQNLEIQYYGLIRTHKVVREKVEQKRSTSFEEKNLLMVCVSCSATSHTTVGDPPWPITLPSCFRSCPCSYIARWRPAIRRAAKRSRSCCGDSWPANKPVCLGGDEGKRSSTRRNAVVAKRKKRKVC